MRKAALIVALLALAAGVGFALRGCPPFHRSATLTSLSPDDKLRVVIAERPGLLDRNFEVRLEGVRTAGSRVVFRSPDEGRPVGSERIVGSADGSRFLLLGRHFIVTSSGDLSTGELAYLMTDVGTGEIWCNAQQQATYPGFSLKQLCEIKWLDWTPPVDVSNASSEHRPLKEEP